MSASDFYYIRCWDAGTKVFVGYLNDDGTTRRTKKYAAVWLGNHVDREVKAINAYGKYTAEKVAVLP